MEMKEVQEMVKSKVLLGNRNTTVSYLLEKEPVYEGSGLGIGLVSVICDWLTGRTAPSTRGKDLGEFATAA